MDSPLNRAAAHCTVCVEDDGDLAHLVALTLRLWPTTVHIAYDGVMGLELIRDLSPNLILLDLGLPGLNGYEIIDTVRSDPRLHATPIVVLSAIPYDPHMLVLEQVDLYLHKPFTPRLLREYLVPYLPSAAVETEPVARLEF